MDEEIAVEAIWVSQRRRNKRFVEWDWVDFLGEALFRYAALATYAINWQALLRRRMDFWQHIAEDIDIEYEQ